MKSAYIKKIVINNRFGAFHLKKEFVETLPEYLKEEGEFGTSFIKYRSDPNLIKALENYGLENACDDGCRLAIVAVPSNIEVYIVELDGKEEIHEVHRVFNADGTIEERGEDEDDEY